MNSIIRLDHWLEEHDFKGYEPRDGLSSKLTPLAFRNWFAERVLQQLVLRCPFHIRPLIGVKPRMSMIGMGFLARGYIRMWNVDQELIWKKRAIYCLDWLIDNKYRDTTVPAGGITMITHLEVVKCRNIRLQ